MKNSNLLILVITVLFCLAATNAKAQLEVKIDPVDIYLRNPKFSVEYGINKNVGVELVAGFRHGEELFRGWLTKTELHKGYTVRAIGKLYLFPETTLDGISLGVYAGPRSHTSYSANENITPRIIEGFTAGIIAGYKLIHESGFLAEVALGTGRNFGYSYSNKLGKDLFGRLTVGYRI